MRKLSMILISDSTGETLISAASAVVSQFEHVEANRKVHRFVRTNDELDVVLDGISPDIDLVAFTVASKDHVVRIMSRCAHLGVPAISLLDPLFEIVSDLTGQAPTGQPGKQYLVDRDYLDQINAIDFAITNDDGINDDYLRQSDVILTGVSRTSKTPTCIYLGYQGIRAANVPLVHGQDHSSALISAIEEGLLTVGLTASARHLTAVRRNRLRSLGTSSPETYADQSVVEQELVDARLFFERHSLPVIDVTRRSIEETAAAVRTLVTQRGKQ